MEPSCKYHFLKCRGTEFDAEFAEIPPHPFDIWFNESWILHRASMTQSEIFELAAITPGQAQSILSNSFIFLFSLCLRGKSRLDSARLYEQPPPATEI